MINYTKEQREAIDYFNSDLIISASAGSGKTQVLLEKVVKLVEKGYKIDDFLVVTFTKQASSEMKAKLENMLDNKFCETKNERFFDAIKSLNVADISTIHAFCQKIVRKYYYILNINQNFEIKDDNFLYFLKNLALDKTFEWFFEKNDEEFAVLANLFAYKRDFKVFKEEILNFYEFLISKVDKFNFISNLIENSYNENLNENELITKFKQYCEKEFEEFKTQILNEKLACEQINCKKLIELCEQIASVISLSFNTNESFVKTFFGDFDFPRIQISSKEPVEAQTEKENLQNIVKEIKNFIKTIKNIFAYENVEKICDSIKISKNLLNKFVDVVKIFEDNYSELKKENNCFDFSDLETLTLKLFENKNILDEISNKYKFIFVDEYQDTNFVQEEILQKLSVNSKRIMVGDLKQSIYAFRECNPKILNDKMKDFRDNNSGKVAFLNKNFRSRREILDFSNNIFKNLMQKENCDYNYETDGMFVCGKDDSEKNENLKPISVVCVNKKSKNISSVKDCENLMILNAINNLLNEKIVVNGVERNLTYSDIAIIGRKRNDKFNTLCKFLSDAKVPTNVKYYEKIYSSFEVKVILAYLKILNNNYDEISLFSVLKNIYHLKTNELITIKTNNFIENVFNYSKNDEILPIIKAFLSDYDYFSNLVFEKDVKNLIKEILNKTKLDLYLLKLFGKISDERIKVFLNSFGDNEFNLSEFLTYCEKISDKKFEVRKVDGENSVVVDTFHATKGLEFNAVIIFGAGENLFSKNTSSLIYNSNVGIGIYDFDEKNKLKNPNLIYSMIKILNKQEEFNEETRLCYVALTRAKNFMCIIGSEKPENLHEEKNMLKFLNFSSYLSLISSAKFEDYVDFDMVDNFDENFSQEEKQKDEEKIELNYDKFNKLFEKDYQFSNNALIQLKNSVTSLSEEDNYIYNITNFKTTDTDSEDFVAKGNAYHKTLEKISFSLQNVSQVHNKIVSLIESHELPENLYSFVEDEKILKAIKNISPFINENDKIFKEQVFLMNVKYNEIVGKNVDDKILIQGIVDLMIEKDDEILLIDYKTSRLNDINLIKKYSLQLNLYEKAISEKFKNKRITKYIYSIFLDKLIKVV